MGNVAGLVPGASQGAGLGNQFLDDLRLADCLVHVVDVSGTTDHEGKVTLGYDPINDVEWLESEIFDWVFGNLWKRWGQITRRHIATNSTIAETFQTQFSGYGTKLPMIQLCVDKFQHKDQLIDKWEKETLEDFVKLFLKIRFPTLIALNKIDLPDSAKNIDRICQKYDPNQVVLTSALSETFLKKLKKQNFIEYEEGTDQISTLQDLPNSSLIPIPLQKTTLILENILDMVLFRYGSTGVQDCVNRVVEMMHLVPVFPVQNINSFANAKGEVLRDCFLVSSGTTIGDIAKMVGVDNYLYCETFSGVRVGEDDNISLDNNVLSFKKNN